MMNSCDVLLVKKINKKFKDLNLYEQGAVPYIIIAHDESTVVTTLQGFFEAFSNDGIGKVPNKDVCVIMEQIVAMLNNWPKYLPSRLNALFKSLRDLQDAQSLPSKRRFVIFWLVSVCDSFKL